MPRRLRQAALASPAGPAPTISAGKGALGALVAPAGAVDIPPWRRSDVDLEAEVDVAGRLTATDAPVLARLFAQHDFDVILRDPERFEVGDDGAIEVPLRIHRPPR